MARCEVCATLGRAPTGRSKHVVVAERLVTLCQAHARVLASMPVAGVEELRQLFHEARGKRSLVERRQELDRRAFPPRPEGRRRNGGRRDGDRLA
jgi:hypothetical protein